MEIKRVPISEVEVWDKNPRNIKTKDFERLKRQIQELGIYKPLICFKENGKYTTLGGNMRLRALKDLKIDEIDISIVTVKDEATKIKYALSDNDRVGQYDEQALAELAYPHIEEINLEDYKLDIGEPISLKDVIEDYAPDIDGEDEIPEIDDSPAITKMGDLFTLGKHRLFCGDATKEEDVKKLMNGEKADLLLTDPPYGVSYVDLIESRQNPSTKWGKIYKDELKDEEFQAWLEKVFLNISKNIVDNAAWYIWHAQKTQGYFTAAAAAAADIIYHRQIVWVKPRFILGRGHYHWKHELCLYGWKKGYEPKIRPPSNETTIWEVEREKVSDYLHPTQKPLELIVRAVRNSSASDNKILDTFLGSGTTLIACEKLNRICYGMEIEPKYCDVIITRYANFTNTPEEEIRATRQ